MSAEDLLRFHAFCLLDTGTRLDQYARAIAARVKPGAVVLDVGTGTGVLALLACRAGARRVYAVDASDAIALAQRLAAAAGIGDCLQFIQASSSQVTLPERADVIVADVHDTFGLQRDGLAAIFDARDRLLAPGGALVPMSVRLMAAPVDAPALYARSVDIWRHQVQGIDLSPLRELAVQQSQAARLNPDELLSPPAVLTSIDLTREHRLHAGGTARTTAARDGVLHGVCGCFVTTLADGITIGNVPGDSDTSNFAHAFFPIASPVEVQTGDAITIRIDTYDGHATRWQVEVAGPGGVRARAEHSSIPALAPSADARRKQTADYRPALTPEGAIERELMDKFDGTRTAADLEAWLIENYGSRFTSRREAVSLLKALIERRG